MMVKKIFNIISILLIIVLITGCVSNETIEPAEIQERYLTLGDMEKIHNRFIEDDYKFIKELENDIYSPYRVVDVDDDYYYISFWDNYVGVQSSDSSSENTYDFQLYYIDKFDSNNMIVDETTIQVVSSQNPTDTTTKYGYQGEYLSDPDNHLVDIISIGFFYGGTKEIVIACSDVSHNQGDGHFVAQICISIDVDENDKVVDVQIDNDRFINNDYEKLYKLIEYQEFILQKIDVSLSEIVDVDAMIELIKSTEFDPNKEVEPRYLPIILNT